MEESSLTVAPEEVLATVSRYLQAEGLDLVADFRKSSGSRIFDTKRDRYFLDFYGCFSTIPLGYNHPKLSSEESLRELGRSAIQKPANPSLYSFELASFLNTFAEVAKPEYMKYLFLIEGGALAVENALKVAFDWKVRKNLDRGIQEERGHQIIHFRQAFHGRSGYTLSLTNTSDPNKTQYFPKFSWPRILNPKCRFPLEGSNLEQTIRDEQEAISQLFQAVEEYQSDIAGLIIEPIQGEGGDNHFRLEFHQTLRDFCDRNEILLIYDEIQTGFGATGKMWAHEYFVKPDILAFGKKSQVCGILVGERIDEVENNCFKVSSRINSTWGGNLTDMVRCRKILEIYREEQVIEKSRKLGGILIRELTRLQDENPEIISNARGRGLFCAIDLPSKQFRDQLRRKLFENGLIILGCGDRSIRFRTALNIPESDLLEGVDIIRKTIQEMT
jgi:L-lysine 6-transaminase